jgi:DivIVA domain-containing protein
VTLLFTLLAMAVVGVVAAVAAGRIRGGLDEPVSSLPYRGLPASPVVPVDLERLRFSPALRGYRMDEVDSVLDRLAEELRRRDEELERLRAGGGRDATVVEGAGFIDRTVPFDQAKVAEPTAVDTDPARPAD